MSEPHPRYSACKRQQNVFARKLPKQSCSAGAERGTNSQPPPPSRASREKQTGDIRTGNQHYAKYSRGQSPERLPGAGSGDLVKQRHNTNSKIPVGRRILAREPRGNGVHLGTCVLDRAARFEAYERAKCVRDPEPLE